MNKYLLMCAAAAMAATASGHIARASVIVHLVSTGGSSGCDYFVITNSGGGLWAAVHHQPITCASTSLVNDAGVLDKGGKVPGTKKSGSVQFADVTFAKAGVGYIGLDYDLSYPFKSGGTWALIANTNGQTAFILDSGVQYLAKVKPGAKKSALHDAIVALGLKN